jgi:ketosteroid isomerase-like protein
MSEIEDLRRRVARLEAREEIGELVSAYAVACDEHDMPRLTGLFTVDAEFDSPSKVMVAKGRDAIAAMFVELFKIRGPGYHWTHDRFVRFDDADPDRATGLVLSHAETTPNAVPSLAAMKYDDVYRRVGGRWLFAKRTIQFLYYVPYAEYASALNAPLRLTVAGQRRAADYPESVPAWQDFARQYGPWPTAKLAAE